jgi:isopenicillin N synthase-like dioxygenase
MRNPIPTLDLSEWKTAGAGRRWEIAGSIDASLRRTGMFLLRGHGVPGELADRMRRCGRAFFDLPTEQKLRYQVRGAYDNGWRGLGLHVVTAVDGVQSAPDLHEAFHMGPTHRTGDVRFDSLYYPSNQWPAELPELEVVATRYTGHMVRVAQEMLTVMATVLGIDEDFFTSRSGRATWTQNVNWYPSLSTVGTVHTEQMRVGPHSDFGTLSLLDRQPGVGGLEVWNDEDGWFAPPYDPGSLAVILGDLMHLWTDGRWRALRHRVLAPSSQAPDEELVSLVFFFEADPDTVVTPLPPPVGGGAGEKPVVAGESILEKVGVAVSVPGTSA